MDGKLFVVGKSNIAKKLGCGKYTVIEYIKHESLPAFQEIDNGPWKITIEALREWSAEYQARKTLQKTLVKS